MKNLSCIILVPFLLPADPQETKIFSLSSSIPTTINLNVHMSNTVDARELNKVAIDTLQQTKEYIQAAPLETQQEISTIKWALKCGLYFVGALSVATLHAVAKGIACGSIKLQ